MVRYVQSVGIGMLALGMWSSPGFAQTPELPLALVGERAALQDAVCAQNWELAIEVSDRLLALDGLPSAYQDEMSSFRERLLQFQSEEMVLPSIPGCEDAEEGTSREAQVVSDRLNELAESMTSPLTQDIVEQVGSDNLLIIRGLCSLLEEGEVENPFELMVASVERNFFGVPMLQLDELEDFQEGDRDQQQAVVEYLSFMSFMGAMQFCPENAPVVEAMFNVDIPDAPTEPVPAAER